MSIRRRLDQKKKSEEDGFNLIGSVWRVGDCNLTVISIEEVFGKINNKNKQTNQHAISDFEGH